MLKDGNDIIHFILGDWKVLETTKDKYLAAGTRYFHSVFKSVYLTFYLYIFLSFYLYIYISFFLSKYPYKISIPFYLYLCLSIYLSIYLSSYQSVCLSIFLSFMDPFLLVLWVVRFRIINASGSRINCGQIATLNPKNSP